jgi:CheY-like chemotaxis protein
MPAPSIELSRFVPNVVVVDPRFDAYKPLAASARIGKLDLHIRSSGREALKLARRMPVDAWLIAPELDDMAGHDLVPLLQAHFAEAGQTAGQSKVAFVDPAFPGCRQWSLAELEARAAGADTVLSQPITFRDLEQLLGLPTEERAKFVGPAGTTRGFVTLPVGVGAAVIAIAVLMMG